MTWSKQAECEQCADNQKLVEEDHFYLKIVEIQLFREKSFQRRCCRKIQVICLSKIRSKESDTQGL